MGPPRRKSSVKLAKSKSTSSKRGSKKRLVEVVDSVTRGSHGEDKDAQTDAEEEERKRQEEARKREEEEERRKKYPIAPDGYVPNSVIRSLFTIHKPPPPPRPESPWKLKPVPTSMSGPNDSDGYTTEEEEEEEGSSSEKEETSPTAVTVSRESTMTSHTTSPQKEKKVTLVTGNVPVRDTDNKMSPRRRMMMSRQGTFTSTISEEVDDISEEPIPLLQKIASESWFPKSVTSNLSGVVSAFCAIMSNVNNSTHRTICDYILQIKSELSLPTTLENKLLDKLISQLAERNEVIRCNAVRTLGMLGNSKKDVIVGILPLLTDPSDDVRTEANIALKRLTDVDTKEGLHRLMEELSIVQNYNSKEDEEKALEQLAQNLMTSGSQDIDAQLPTEDAHSKGMVESWLDEAEGTETDNSGLFSEEGSFDGSAHVGSPRTEAGHGKVAKGRRQSRAKGRGQPNGPQRGPTGGSTVVKDNITKNTLGIPVLDPFDEAASIHSVESVTTEQSHIAKYDKNGLYPNNPALYKVYDKRNTERGQEKSNLKTTKAAEGGLHTGHVVIPSEGSNADGAFSESNKTHSEQRTSRTDNTKTTGTFEETSIPRNSLTEDDSGLGQTATSDDLSNTSRDKTAVVSSLQYQPRSNLSPVISTNRDLYEHDSVTDADDENWREFFNRPNIRERRRQLEEESGQLTLDPSGGGAKASQRDVSLPPIRYLSDDTELVAGDPGVRLLHSVTVKPKSSDSCGSDDERLSKRHKIDPVPGKLGCSTTEEDFGFTKFGILDLHWTTGIPFTSNLCRCFVAHRHHNVPNSTPQSTYTGDLRQVLMAGHQNNQDNVKHAKLNTIKFKQEVDNATPNTKPVDNKLFPSLTNQETGYEWIRPLPPAPDRESRLANVILKQDHKHYCDYYRLLKKRMHNHISLPVITAPLQPEIPKVKVTDESFSLPTVDTQPLTSASCEVMTSHTKPSALLPFISWRTVLSCDT